MTARLVLLVSGSGNGERVEELDFQAHGPQVWWDSWRQSDRLCRFAGLCVICGRRTYAFDDGENDPRGVLGDHAASPLYAADYQATGPDIPLCFMHANEEAPYKAALAVARRLWRPVGTGGADAP